MGLAPQIPATASRTAVPLYYGGKQAGKSTTTSWSRLLKKMLALGSVKTECAQLGTKLQMELTVEAVRHTVTASVVQMPF
jgi:glycine cleavage system aminomethyltransferase T